MLSKILDICEDHKCDVTLDSMPKDYYFELKYEDNVIVSLYECHDENNRVRHKRVYGKCDELNMNLKEYCNLIRSIYEWKLMKGATGAIRTERIIYRVLERTNFWSIVCSSFFSVSSFCCPVFRGCF